MNSIKCPQCGLVNWGTPPACKRCGASFEGVSAQAFVSIPAGEQVYAPGFPVDPMMNLAQETERTRKIWKWFVAYCVLMTLLYLISVTTGAVLLVFSFTSLAEKPDISILRTQATAFLLIGVVLMIPYAMGPFVKGKSWGWVFGIVLIAIGMTSCCLWPITIPLLIQWIKPEMKRAFGQS
jgi:hypothetical protein